MKLNQTPVRAMLLLAALFLALPGAMSACSNTKTAETATDAVGAPDPNATCTGKFCLAADVRYKLDPGKISFQDLQPTDPAQTQSVRIAHIGTNGTMRLQNPRFDKAMTEFSDDFLTNPQVTTVGNFKVIDLQPGQYVDFTVTYKPLKAGTRTLNLLLDSNATDDKKVVRIPVEVVEGGKNLTIQPNPVNFGNLATGADSTLDVQLINFSSKAVNIISVTLAPSGSTDFTLVNIPDPATPVAPGASVTLQVKYKPTGGNQDTSTLLVETDDKRKVTAPVLGNEIAPLISVFPPKLDYGAIKKGDQNTLPLKITNKGLAPLTVSAINLSELTLQAKLIDPADVVIAPPPPYTLDPFAEQVLQVTFTPSQVMPANGSPGTLQIESNDASDPKVMVPILAHTDAPVIQVSVQDVACTDPTQQCQASYGNVGKATPPTVLYSKRKITIVDAGTAPLEVQSIDISDDTLGEFSIDPKNTIPPADSPPQLQSLDPFKPVDFLVRFQNKGAPSTDATANLNIHSSDPAHPIFTVKLLASRADGTTCKIALIPQPVNFGLMPYGKSKVLPVTVKNEGSGPCKYKGASLVTCYQAPGLIGGSTTKCSTASSPFYSTGPVATNLFELAPGDSGKMLLQFQAPDSLATLTGGPAADVVTEIDALLVLKYQDETSQVESYYPNADPTSLTTIGNAKPNLVAKVGLSKVVVLPDNIDFGTITLGCKSPEETASIYNKGATDVNVTKVTLDGCGPEVQFVNKPAIPKTGLAISQKVPQSFKVQYGPQKVGKMNCQLTITTGQNGMCTDNVGSTSGACDKTSDCTKAGETCLGDSFAVPLVGEGTLDTEYTDHYDQADGKKSDIVFVVDNSGSMDNKQAQLKQNIALFVQIASLWTTDYHLGVVTTDMSDTSQSGRFQTFTDGGGTYRFVAKTLANAGKDLETLAGQGSAGSGTEEGIVAALTAVTLPLIQDAKKVCTKDSDCTSVGGKCTTNPDDGTKGCGGENRAFLRKFAGLEVVVLSDEDDQSPDTISYYLNAFYAIKGTANKNLFHFHAIAGDIGGCTGNGDAVSCDRYNDMVKKTGGKFGSICASNYAQTIQDIGTMAFGLALQYFLTRTPEVSTVTVKVSGVDCPQGPDTWNYDATSNSVIFVDKGKCVPQTNDKIDIHYKMLCIQ